MESATKVAPGGLEKGSAEGATEPVHWRAQPLRGEQTPACLCGDAGSTLDHAGCLKTQVAAEERGIVLKFPCEPAEKERLRKSALMSFSQAKGLDQIRGAYLLTHSEVIDHNQNHCLLQQHHHHRQICRCKPIQWNSSCPETGSRAHR